MRVLVIGAVRSTERTISGLIRNGVVPVAILGYDFHINGRNEPSGFCDLSVIAKEHSIPFKPFYNINDVDIIAWAKSLKLDAVFATGFSQLLSSPWFTVAKNGCIGFHPTKLPKGRGRAPLAWLILNEQEGAANFFSMTDRADDGPIFVQIPFDIEIEDNASSVEKKILGAIDKALDRWIPRLLEGDWTSTIQDESSASYYGLRKPIDGYVDWKNDSTNIYKLVKASSSPHPNAFTFYKNFRVEILDAAFYNDQPFIGVLGRVLDVKNDNWLLVQCSDHPLWIKYQSPHIIKIGQDLGIDFVSTVLRLNEEIEKLKGKMNEK